MLKTRIRKVCTGVNNLSVYTPQYKWYNIIWIDYDYDEVKSWVSRYYGDNNHSYSKYNLNQCKSFLECKHRLAKEKEAAGYYDKNRNKVVKSYINFPEYRDYPKRGK